LSKICSMLLIFLLVGVSEGITCYLGPYQISFEIIGINSTRIDPVLVTVGPLVDFDEITRTNYTRYVGLINDMEIIPWCGDHFNDGNVIIVRQYEAPFKVNRSLLQAELEDMGGVTIASSADLYSRRIDGYEALVMHHTEDVTKEYTSIAIFCIDERNGYGTTFFVLGTQPILDIAPGMNKTEFDWLMDSFHIISGPGVSNNSGTV